MSVADICFASMLRHPFRLVLDEKFRTNNPNLTKWFSSMSSHEVFMKRFGKIWFCNKEMEPDYEINAPQKQKVEKAEKPKK